ncbi:maturase K [Gossypium australe]|uniref:Maturase K n=1 Tax=Gossypium australe TaxID=47621 RepID=A0A5B6VL37_9ROSI|nr:maturase K [Gossypium australe]
MLENLFIIDNAVKTLDTRIPIISLIGSLSKAKFCNTLGHPISKPTWADFSDSDIIDQFVRISRNLSHYHSGSSKKKVCINKIYFGFLVLKLWLVNTKVRNFWKNSLRKRRKNMFFLIFPRGFFALRKFYRGRIWYLDIICINALVNHS